MKKVLSIGFIAIFAMLFSGCVYTDSALKYANEGTKRVNAGYDAKAKMTKEITEYLKVANKDCGVQVKVIDNVPVTTVKECIRLRDALASVDNIEIIKPQKIADIASGVGDFILKSTNLVVPLANVYYANKNTEVQSAANVEITKSNNALQDSMMSNYTGNFQNTTNTTSTDKDYSVTNTTSTDSSNIQTTTDTTR